MQRSGPEHKASELRHCQTMKSVSSTQRSAVVRNEIQVWVLSYKMMIAWQPKLGLSISFMEPAAPPCEPWALSLQCDGQGHRKVPNPSQLYLGPPCKYFHREIRAENHREESHYVIEQLSKSLCLCPSQRLHLLKGCAHPNIMYHS